MQKKIIILDNYYLIANNADFKILNNRRCNQSHKFLLTNLQGIL